MKRHSEEIARRESLPRKVKKAVTAREKRERKSKPKSFPSWNLLPNEMKVAIVQKMDVATSVSFSECGWNESQLVRNHSRRLVDIILKFFGIVKQVAMVIYVRDAESETEQLKWRIYKNQFGDTVVEYYVMSLSPKPQTLNSEGKSVEETISMILRRLLTKPKFVVNELTLKLWEYGQKIDLGSIRANVNLLTLAFCCYSKPVLSIIRNKNLNFKKVVGTNHNDRRILYEFDTLTYGRPRTIPAGSSFPRELNGCYYSFLSTVGPQCYQNAYERFKGFWDVTLGLYNFVNISAVERTLELRKTTDDIMILRAAYYYDDYCVPYIQNRPDDAENIVYAYSDRIAFLEDGIDDHLSDYQLTVLSIAYLVRLFRNEPEIRKIYNIAFEDLKLVLKKFENVNLYEKLVAKLEALVP